MNSERITEKTAIQSQSPLERAISIIERLKLSLDVGDSEGAYDIIRELKFPQKSEIPLIVSCKYAYYAARTYAENNRYTEAEESLYLAKSNISTTVPNVFLFKIAVFKLEILVKLLQGKVPQLSVFKKYPTKFCLTLKKLTTCVLKGDRKMLDEVIKSDADQLRIEGLYLLVKKLPQALLRVALRKCSRVYSRCHLSDIMKHCSLSSELSAIWALTEGVGRGDFACEINLETKVVKFQQSKSDVTVEEILELCERATDIHRAAIKGLVYFEPGDLPINDKEPLKAIAGVKANGEDMI